MTFSIVSDWMILKTLKLVNWKSFENKEFDFSEGINLILGDNYSGKTSFIQAIYYGLFGEMLYDKELTAIKLRREETENATIELNFIIDGQKFRIRRNIEGKKRVNVNSYFYRINDKNEEIEEIESFSLTAKQKQESKKEFEKLEKLLKISRDFVKNINFIQEESIYLFLSNPTFAIDEDLNKILKLNYIGQLINYCDKKIKKQKDEIESLKKKKKICEEFIDKNTSTINDYNEDLKDKQKEIIVLENKIEEINNKKEILSLFENMVKIKNELNEKIEQQKKQEDSLSNDLLELQSRLEEISKLEERFDFLKKKMKIFESNKNQINTLEKEKEVVQNKLNSIEKDFNFLADRETSLKKKMSEMDLLTQEITPFVSLKNQLKNLKVKKEQYDNTLNQLDQIQNKINSLRKVIKKFKGGICPVDNETCPVADKKVNDREQNLKGLEVKELEVTSILKSLQNPEEKIQIIQNKMQDLLGKKKDIKRLNEEISNLQKEITKLKENTKERNNLLNKKANLKKRIENINVVNEKLKNEHEEYIRVEERIKDKQEIIKEIEGKKKKLEEIQSAIKDHEKIIKEKEREIENFKEAKKIIDPPQKNKLESKIKTLEAKLNEEKTEKTKISIQLEDLKKQLVNVLDPYSKVEDIYNDLETKVHELYKVLFFQEALSETLKELKERKFRQIKDHCSRMWATFKGGATLDSIGWDENYIPYVLTGGNKRNIYQLSASEKIIIYFSIRAALLANLGLNLVMVADNLLMTIMKDNKNTILELLKNTIEKTNIEQIIITGFDIPETFKCDNKIII